MSRPGQKLAGLQAGAGRRLRTRSLLGSWTERRRQKRRRRRRQRRLWRRRSALGPRRAGGAAAPRRNRAGAEAGAARGQSCRRPVLVLSLAALEAAPALPAPSRAARLPETAGARCSSASAAEPVQAASSYGNGCVTSSRPAPRTDHAAGAPSMSLGELGSKGLTAWKEGRGMLGGWRQVTLRQPLMPFRPLLLILWCVPLLKV